MANADAVVLVAPRATGPENPDAVVLVGEYNPDGPAEGFALYPDPPHSAGGRLLRILGVEEDRYLAFWRLNLCAGPWSRRAGSLAAQRLYDSLAAATPATVVVLLGVQVSAAFTAVTIASQAGLARARALACWERGSDALGRARWLSLPHPSGLCRVWGDGMWEASGTVARARGLLRDVCPHVPWGATYPVPRDEPTPAPRSFDAGSSSVSCSGSARAS